MLLNSQRQTRPLDRLIVGIRNLPRLSTMSSLRFFGGLPMRPVSRSKPSTMSLGPSQMRCIQSICAIVSGAGSPSSMAPKMSVISEKLFERT